MDGKKLSALLICTILAFTNITGTFYDLQVDAASNSYNIKESEAKRSRIKEKKNSLTKTLEETREKVNSKRQQCNAVNKQILAVQEQIYTINDNIEKLDKEIAEKIIAITDKQKEIQENTDILMHRLVAVYKAGEIHAIDLILSAKTFDDFIDKAEIISRISAYDNKLINALKNDIKEIEDQKKIIEDKKAIVEAEKVKLSAKKESLQNLLSENEKLLKELEGEQKIAQAEIDENDAEYQKIQNEITRYYAEEEKRRKEQEQLKQKNASYAEKMNTMMINSSGKGFAWPVPGFMRLSSEYMEKRGRVYHKGIDIAGYAHSGIYGKPVVAVDNGIVISAYNGCHHDYGKIHSCGCGGGYGNYVMIAHANGKLSIYGHLSRVCVSKGQTVSRSEKIGEVGTTGYSTGPHLHFQTKHNGIDYNPMDEYRK